MKVLLQIPAPRLVNDIRKAKTFRVPENVLLLLLVFVAVFAVIEVLESLAISAGLMPHMMEWANEQIATLGRSLTTKEAMDKIKNMMRDPENMRIVLFGTVVGTLGAMCYCRFVEGRKLRTMGFYKKGAAVQYLLGLLMGFLAFSMVVGMSYLLGGVRLVSVQPAFSGAQMLMLLGFGIQGMSEETICRGFMMTSAMRRQNFWFAAVSNSVIFSLAHIFNPGFTVLTFINITLAGLIFSVYVLRTGNIWGACAFHSIWNYAQGSIYGLPVSGVSVGDTLFTMELTGSKLVNGGDFGLESGIGCTIVCTIWILVLLFVPNPFRKKQEETA